MSGNRFGKVNLRRLTGRFLRGAALAGAAVCAWPRREPVWLAGLVPSASPFNALLTVAAGAGGLFLLGALAVAVACVFWPRAFCRWLCPTGTCQNAVSGFRFKLSGFSQRASRRKPKPRSLPPKPSPLKTKPLPRPGVWLVFIGVGAALAGYPLFGWLDPLALFNAAFGAARRQLEWRDWLAAAGLPLLLLLALAAPGLWCGRLCPLGALQDLLRAPFRIRALNPALRSCETAAIGRRAFLGLSLGAGYRLARSPARTAPARPALRPPAADGDARFTRRCTRCGACVRSCPSGILGFGGRGAGWAGVLAPELCFDYGYCQPSCTRCGQVCPSGAIPRFTRKTKHARPMGLAAVDEKACLLSQSRECGACVGACQYGALDLAWNPENMTSRVVADAALCTGCGCCEYVCPASPKAMRVHAPARSRILKESSI